MDNLNIDFPHLREKILFNKMSQNVGITRMEKGVFSSGICMEVTCHMDFISYVK